MRAIFFLKNNVIEDFIIKVSLLIVIIFVIIFSTFFVGNVSTIYQFVILIPVLFIAYVCVLLGVNCKMFIDRELLKDFIVLGLIILYCVVNSAFFSEHLIEGGHDQGVYLEAAFLLANTGKLSVQNSDFSFVQTFPGWIRKEDKTVLGFSPGSAVFLSIFVKMFGFWGIKAVNSFLLFFTSSLIYFLVKKIKDFRTAVIWLIFFLFCFYTIYFTRATYIENFQIFFIWLYILVFIRGYLEKDITQIIIASWPLTSLLTIRQEGFLYFVVYLIIGAILLLKRIFKLNASILFACFLSAVIFFSVWLGLVRFNDSYLGPIAQFLASSSKVEMVSNPPYNYQIFTWINIFYMFTPVFLMLVIIAIIGIKKESSVVKWSLIIIVLLLLPQFAFLIKPGIAFYLPWFMRRYWAILIPLFFIVISLFLCRFFILSKIFSKKVSVLIIAIIFLIFSLPGLSILFTKQGNGVASFEKTLGDVFTQSDLVIFWDRYKWENLGPPLFFFYNKNIIFDRPPALDVKTYAQIMRGYKNVYIATSILPTQSDTSIHPYFDGHLKYQISLESSPFYNVKNSCDTRIFIIQPELFTDYDQIEDLCSISIPRYELSSDTVKVNIYKLNNDFKEQFVNQNYDASFAENIIDLEK